MIKYILIEEVTTMEYKAYRFKIEPNTEQKTLINKTLGDCRYVYNNALDYRQAEYKAGRSIHYAQTAAHLAELKKTATTAWLNEVDSVALQQCLRDQETAFQRFFAHKAGYPRYRAKYDARQSYRTINTNNNIRLVDDKHIKLPKLGIIKVRKSRDIGQIHSVTVSKSPVGKYYVSILCGYIPEDIPATGAVIGIDVGIKSFATDSNGREYTNPKYLRKTIKKLKREQRKLSRKEKSSKNRNKQHIKVAKLHEKVHNQRYDHHQKLSTQLIREIQTICIEDLNIKGMVRNHKLAQAIADAAWGEFFRELEYKAQWYGRKIVRVPTFYPSSQLCHNCGYKNTRTKDLSVRHWCCPQCGAQHDRDVNAAESILIKGLGIVSA